MFTHNCTNKTFVTLVYNDMEAIQHNYNNCAMTLSDLSQNEYLYLSIQNSVIQGTAKMGNIGTYNNQFTYYRIFIFGRLESYLMDMSQEEYWIVS